MKKKLGLIVNPVAGMGGRVGLKGTDGKEILEKAKKLGAISTSPTRAKEALEKLITLKESIQLITFPHEMGEDEAKECSFNPMVIGSVKSGNSTSEDTIRAAKEMEALGVDLILFAGGDGTARDIFEAINSRIPALGIPAGVKIQSGVFAINPARAGDLAGKYIKGEILSLRELEVMDIDEEAYRDNRLSARLYGYLKVPFQERTIQNSKEASVSSEKITLGAIASEVVEEMDNEYMYILGPGTTIRPIAQKLQLQKTLLGVDVIKDGKLVASDVNEGQLLELIKDKKAKIIVTVIGGQGFVFGRGNQQISPRVIRIVGRENIIIVATPEKLSALKGRTLLIDTGDQEVDDLLSGYHKVVTGYARRSVYKIQSR